MVTKQNQVSFKLWWTDPSLWNLNLIYFTRWMKMSSIISSYTVHGYQQEQHKLQQKQT